MPKIYQYCITPNLKVLTRRGVSFLQSAGIARQKSQSGCGFGTSLEITPDFSEQMNIYLYTDKPILEAEEEDANLSEAPEPNGPTKTLNKFTIGSMEGEKLT